MNHPPAPLLLRFTPAALAAVLLVAAALASAPAGAGEFSTTPGYPQWLYAEHATYTDFDAFVFDLHRRESRLADGSVYLEGRGDAKVYPHHGTPLWILGGKHLTFERFTLGGSMDQGLTVGTPNWVPPDRAPEHIIFRDGMVAFGLRFVGHEDDLARLNTGRKPYGHSHGTLVFNGSRKVRFEGLVLAFNDSRALGHYNGEDQPVTLEFINCVVYNPSQFVLKQLGDNPHPGTKVNVINCLFIEGPDSRYTKAGVWGENNQRAFEIGTFGNTHLSGNLWVNQDGSIQAVKDRFLTQAELKAMPRKPFDIGLPATQAVPAERLIYFLPRFAQRGVFEKFVIDAILTRDPDIRNISSIDELPKEVREDILSR